MREITTHKINKINDSIDIHAGDPGPGGAPQSYSVKVRTTPTEGFGFLLGFHNGPPERGTNGFTNEALLAIVSDRLREFQKGPFPCEENDLALDYVMMAMDMLAARSARVEKERQSASNTSLDPNRA